MLYDIAFFMFSIFYLPTLLFKGKLHREFLERFGIFSRDKEVSLASGKDVIWIQAVSVGEVSLCKGLLPLLKERFPHSSIVLSTVTKTGNDLAKNLFSNTATVIYFPLDFTFIVKKVVAKIRPKIYVMVETEIWPNLLKEVYRGSIPAILINGRISNKSFGKYKLVRPFLKNILEEISLFCMQSKVYAERIISLGAPESKVRVTGNMKFDVNIAQGDKSVNRMRELIGLKDGQELFVAGSTHNGEEEAILEAFKALVKDFPKLKLLIAPRHIDRVSEVEKTVKRCGLVSQRISNLNTERTTPDGQGVLILDTIGQLNDVYAISTLVFVGGSLIRHGGQNPIEPAVLEKPVLFGPHMFNFNNITNVLLGNNAAMQVVDGKDLFEKSRFLLSNREELSSLGRNAKRIVLENRGATVENLKAISEVL